VYVAVARCPQVLEKSVKAPSSRKTKNNDKNQRAIGRPANKKSVGKEVILQRTIELLRTVPPEKLSLTLAAKNAGVHLTLIKYYFHDRTRLLVAVARHLTLELGDRVRISEGNQSPALDRLQIRIDMMVDYYLLNPYYHRLMMEIIADEEHELAGELIHEWISKTLEIYDGIIDGGVKEGKMRAVDTRFTYLAIMGLCEQFHLGERLFARANVAQREPTQDLAIKYKKFVRDLVFDGIALRTQT
jgi:AcrR family transcriptional regulator